MFARFFSIIGSFATYVGALVLGAGAVYFYFYVNVLSPLDSSSTVERSFEVERNASIRTVAHKLESAGLIARWWSLLLLSRAAKDKADPNKSVTIMPGEYRLSPSLTPREILQKLVKGEVVYHEITIPEGTTLAEIPALLAKTTLVTEEEVRKILSRRDLPGSMGIPSDTFEGYIFPDTYRFTRPDNADFMIRRTVQLGNEKRSKEMYERAIDLGFTFHQILTLASIIEKETGDAAERPMISSVFHNRLRIGMPLQSDPTVIYGVKNFNGNLTREHLNTPGPYNTYLNTGLPPSPICNPGLEALKAALYPTDTDNLYFVARGDGTHQFSATYKDHVKAVQMYQRGGPAGAGAPAAAPATVPPAAPADLPPTPIS